MDNQHRHIKGYRELTPEEINLMNRIKTAGAELLALQREVVQHIAAQVEAVAEAGNAASDWDRLLSVDGAEPGRWAAIARTDIQTGVMALVRAVAQPMGV